MRSSSCICINYDDDDSSCECVTNFPKVLRNLPKCFSNQFVLKGKLLVVMSWLLKKCRIEQIFFRLKKPVWYDDPNYYDHPSTPWVYQRKLGTISTISHHHHHSEFNLNFLRDCVPNLSHKGQLHYFNAVIHESMRKSNVVPSGVPHYVEEDTYVDHYFFPKGISFSNLIWG